MKKALLSILMALVLVSGMMLSAFAEGETSNVTLYTEGGDIVTDGDTTTVAFSTGTTTQWSPADSSIGRSDAWWVGIKVTAPAGTDTTVAKYRRINQWWLDHDGNSTDWSEAKSFEAYKDGADFIGLWNMVVPAYLTAYGSDDKTLNNRYEFDWNGDGVYEQKITVKISEGIEFDMTGLEAAYVDSNGIYKAFTTLADAVAAVPQNNANPVTIKLLKDAEGAGIGLWAADHKNIVIDFDRHTYKVTSPCVGSSGTQNQAFHLEEGNTVTLKNGTITSATALMLVQNYSNLTVDNMVLDGTQLPGTAPYAMSNNNGDVVIKDTTINAKEGGFAFDVWSFGSYTGANVTVQGNSVINGKVDVGISTGADHSNLALSIEGGKINGVLSHQEALADTIVVTGGSVDSTFAPFIDDSELAVVEDENGNLVVSAPVAKIGDVNYATVKAAGLAAQNGQTIKVVGIVAAGDKITAVDGRVYVEYEGDMDSILGNGVAYNIVSGKTVIFEKTCLESDADCGHHRFEKTWTTNSDCHWKACDNCSAKAFKGPHRFGAATVGADGETVTVCAVCGYTK